MATQRIDRCHVFNPRNQPVELHLAGRTIVLPPFEEVELDGADLGTPQLRYLQERRYLVVRSLRQAAERREVRRAEQPAASETPRKRVPGKKAPGKEKPSPRGVGDAPRGFG
jgi:hypothetical protein